MIFIIIRYLFIEELLKEHHKNVFLDFLNNFDK